MAKMAIANHTSPIINGLMIRIPEVVMRKTVLLVGISVAVAFVLRVAPSAQSVATGYLTPPKVVADIMDAEPLPAVTLSPDRRTMLLLHRRSMMSRLAPNASSC